MSGFTGIRKKYFKDSKGVAFGVSIEHWKNGRKIKEERKRIPDSINQKYMKKLQAIESIGKYQKKLIELTNKRK